MVVANVWQCALTHTVLPLSHHHTQLLDICMPLFDGYEVARRLRAIEAERNWRPLPIIALTAMSLSEDKEMALAVGYVA